jgi:hypothetical protein
LRNGDICAKRSPRQGCWGQGVCFGRIPRPCIHPAAWFHASVNSASRSASKCPIFAPHTDGRSAVFSSEHEHVCLDSSDCRVEWLEWLESCALDDIILVSWGRPCPRPKLGSWTLRIEIFHHGFTSTRIPIDCFACSGMHPSRLPRSLHSDRVWQCLARVYPSRLRYGYQFRSDQHNKRRGDI